MYKIVYFSSVILYLSVNNCNSCRSTQKSPKHTVAPITTTSTMLPIVNEEPLRNLFVEGNINGIVIQKLEDDIPTPIYFKQADQIQYSCRQNYTKDDNDDMIVRWYQKKGDTLMFIGNPSKYSAQIQMKLYKFDNNSVLLCVANSSKVNNTVTITLNLNDTRAETITHVKNIQTTLGKKFTKSCDKDGYLQAVTKDNSKIITNAMHLYGFNVEQRNDGMLFYCVELHTHETDNSVSTVRKIKEIDRLIVSKINTNNGNETDSNGNVFRELVIIIPVTCLVVILICLLCICIRRKQRITDNRDNVNLQEEPVYSDPQQIIYAQLQMAEDARSRPPNKIGQVCETYAEIIGVLEPCKS